MEPVIQFSLMMFHFAIPADLKVTKNMYVSFLLTGQNPGGRFHHIKVKAKKKRAQGWGRQSVFALTKLVISCVPVFLDILKKTYSAMDAQLNSPNYTVPCAVALSIL